MLKIYKYATRNATRKIKNRLKSSGLWSGIQDLNLRPHRPERCALPNCANSRFFHQLYNYNIIFIICQGKIKKQ